MSMKERIKELRTRLGGKVAVVAHYYENKEIVEAADLVGDSYGLAVKLHNFDAEHIIFCGVRFMAESAAILKKENQHIHLPEHSAACDLAKMADAETFVRWYDSIKGARKPVPIVYVNSSSRLKAEVGKRGGTTCTSSNAFTIMKTIYNNGERLCFLPDKNLGLNIAEKVGIPSHQIQFINANFGAPGTKAANFSPAGMELFLWNGYCPVHDVMEQEDIRAVRKKHHGAYVAVHPECKPEVVEESDFAGSTSQIRDIVMSLPAGTVCAIGTEWNFVEHMKRDRPDLTVLHLHESSCKDMHKITEESVVHNLEAIKAGDASYEVTVDASLAEDAGKALRRMISYTERGKGEASFANSENI